MVAAAEAAAGPEGVYGGGGAGAALGGGGGAFFVKADALDTARDGGGDRAENEEEADAVVADDVERPNVEPPPAARFACTSLAE